MKTDKRRNQAIKKWGKETVEKWEANILKLPTNKFQELILKQKTNWEDLFESRFESPTSLEVQKLIKDHYKITTVFWGRKPDKESYNWLADTYLQGDKYANIEAENNKEFTKFLVEAMKYFCEKNL